MDRRAQGATATLGGTWQALSVHVPQGDPLPDHKLQPTSPQNPTVSDTYELSNQRLNGCDMVNGF